MFELKEECTLSCQDCAHEDCCVSVNRDDRANMCKNYSEIKTKKQMIEELVESGECSPECKYRESCANCGYHGGDYNSCIEAWKKYLKNTRRQKMSKKTALICACEELEQVIYSCGCSNCPVMRGCKLDKFSYSHEVCADKLKQYFQEKADIPDGWDVVLEVKQMCEDEQLVPNYEEDNYEAGFNAGKNDVIDFIDNRLEQAGIEV